MYVLIVGWNKTDSGQEYFNVKSHMGMTWGDQGFFRISTDQAADGNGACGILSKNLMYQI